MADCIQILVVLTWQPLHKKKKNAKEVYESLQSCRSVLHGLECVVPWPASNWSLTHPVCILRAPLGPLEPIL